MTIVESYIREHTGKEWYRILRIPITFFAAFELLLLFMIAFNEESKLSFALRNIGGYKQWLTVIVIGSVLVLFGMLFRGFKGMCKYHVTSTSQLLNSIAWGAAGFVVLDTTNENALAVGLFFLSVINVFFAIVDEGWGDRPIKA